MEHGIIFENVTEFVQFKPQKVFANFMNQVTEHRKAADADKTLALIGTLYKNIGNGAYGKTMERKSKFTSTKFCDMSTASTLVNRPQFIDADSVGLGVSLWELTLEKSKYYENNCKQLAAFILG